VDKSREYESREFEQARDAGKSSLQTQGFTFESASPVTLMLQRMQPDYLPPSNSSILWWLSNTARDGDTSRSDGKSMQRRPGHSCCGGNGAVSALTPRCESYDIYPGLARSPDDYKVRILDSENGTGAMVRVLIDPEDGSSTGVRWGPTQI
jgi:hypothetical protein